VLRWAPDGRSMPGRSSCTECMLSWRGIEASRSRNHVYETVRAAPTHACPHPAAWLSADAWAVLACFVICKACICPGARKACADYLTSLPANQGLLKHRSTKALAAAGGRRGAPGRRAALLSADGRRAGGRLARLLRALLRPGRRAALLSAPHHVSACASTQSSA